MINLDTQLTWVMEAVVKELRRAYKLYPDWPADPVTAAAIVVEEAGELIQSALDVHWHGLTGEDANMIDEAIQTAAMAVRFVMEHTKNG